MLEIDLDFPTLIFAGVSSFPAHLHEGFVFHTVLPVLLNSLAGSPVAKEIPDILNHYIRDTLKYRFRLIVY